MDKYSIWSQQIKGIFLYAGYITYHFNCNCKKVGVEVCCWAGISFLATKVVYAYNIVINKIVVGTKFKVPKME